MDNTRGTIDTTGARLCRPLDLQSLRQSKKQLDAADAQAATSKCFRQAHHRRF